MKISNQFKILHRHPRKTYSWQQKSKIYPTDIIALKISYMIDVEQMNQALTITILINVEKYSLPPIQSITHCKKEINE